MPPIPPGQLGKLEHSIFILWAKAYEDFIKVLDDIIPHFIIILPIDNEFEDVSFILTVFRCAIETYAFRVELDAKCIEEMANCNA